MSGSPVNSSAQNCLNCLALQALQCRLRSVDDISLQVLHLEVRNDFLDILLLEESREVVRL